MLCSVPASTRLSYATTAPTGAVGPETFAHQQWHGAVEYEVRKVNSRVNASQPSVV